MIGHFFDPAAPSRNWEKPATFAEFPHGLVVPPPEVLEAVAKDKARFPDVYNTPDREKKILDSWTLDYYFEGIPIAFRTVPGGVEVLAVGEMEVGDLVEASPPEERSEVLFAQP